MLKNLDTFKEVVRANKHYFTHAAYLTIYDEIYHEFFESSDEEILEVVNHFTELTKLELIEYIHNLGVLEEVKDYLVTHGYYTRESFAIVNAIPTEIAEVYIKICKPNDYIWPLDNGRFLIYSK